MQKFTDCSGENWGLDINWQTRNVVLRDADFDVYEAVDPEQMQRLENPELLIAVLYAVCEDQIKTRDLTPEQFAARFAGEVIADAAGALLKAIADFFPNRRREVLSAILEKNREIQDFASRKMKLAVSTITESVMEAILKDSSAKSPPLSASTPQEAP